MSAPWFFLSLNLENEVFGHCIVFLEKTRQVLILGGTRDNVRLKEIWIYDLDEYNMPRSASDFNGHVIGQKPKKGPDMLYARSEFGCSTFKHDEDEVVVVSGGRGAENRAEILFISTGDWMPRKYLKLRPFEFLAQSYDSTIKRSFEISIRLLLFLNISAKMLLLLNKPLYNVAIVSHLIL